MAIIGRGLQRPSCLPLKGPVGGILLKSKHGKDEHWLLTLFDLVMPRLETLNNARGICSVAVLWGTRNLLGPFVGPHFPREA